MLFGTRRALRAAKHPRPGLPRGDVPQADTAVQAADGQSFAVGGKGNGMDLLLLGVLERAQEFARRAVPQPHGLIVAAGGEDGAGGRPGRGVNVMLMALEGVNRLRFEAEGVTSPEVGAAYRREILEPNARWPMPLRAVPG